MINVPITKILFLDIETVGITKDLPTCSIEKPEIANQFEHYYDWFQKRFPEDHVGVPLDDDEVEFTKNEVFKKRTALVPEFCKIVCVTFAFVLENGEVRKQTFSDHNEKELLTNVNKLMDRCYRLDFYMCGHNLKNFDIPVLAKRMIINGIKPSSLLPSYSTKPWEVKAIDTKEIWQYGSYSSIGSLDLMCSSLGIQTPKDGAVVGSNVHHSYWDLDMLDEIAEYCEKDVLVLVEIIKKLKSLQ